MNGIAYPGDLPNGSSSDASLAALFRLDASLFHQAG